MSDYFSMAGSGGDGNPLLTPSKILDQPLLTASDLLATQDPHVNPELQDVNISSEFDSEVVDNSTGNNVSSNNGNTNYNAKHAEFSNSENGLPQNANNLMYNEDKSLPNFPTSNSFYQEQYTNGSANQSSMGFAYSNSGYSGLTPQFNDEMSLQANEPHFFQDLIKDTYSLNTASMIDKLNRHNNANDKEDIDHVLPRSNRLSPFYTTVPIPKPVKLSDNDNGDGDGYAEEDIYDADNHFVKEYPTVLLADRFYKWKKILKALSFYLKEVAYSQEEFARINTQLKDSVKFKFLTDLDEQTNSLIDPLTTRKLAKKAQPVTLAEQKKMGTTKSEYFETPSSAQGSVPNSNAVNHDFTSPLAASGFMKFGSGSVQDLQIILKKYHLSQASQQYKISKEIMTNIIPKLLSLRKDLTLKIRDIKSLHDNFKTNISEHITITSQLLNKYIAACKVVNSKKYDQRIQKIKPKHDPFLLKLQLDLQLKRQLKEENYLREAFINLQTSGLKLEKIVYSSIQDTLQTYSTLIGSEAQLMIKNLSQELHKGICSNPPAIEWDLFISCHRKGLMNWRSVDPIPPERQVTDIEYPRRKSPLGKCVKSGYLKFQQDDSKASDGYFVLTANFLHEFKSSNLYKSNNNSTASFANQQATSANIKIDHHGKFKGQPSKTVVPPPTVSKKKTLIPNFSIPLDKCTFVEATDKKLVLRGPAIVPERFEVATHSVSQKNTSSNKNLVASNIKNVAHAADIAAHTTSKEMKKAGKTAGKTSLGFAKFLRGSTHSKKKSSSASKPLHHLETDIHYSEDISRPLESKLWTFTLEEEIPAVHDLRYFKKWVTDIKRLLSFSNVAERANFIEECSIKAKIGNQPMTRNSSLGMNQGYNTPMNEFNDGSKAYISQFTQSSLTIPETSRNPSGSNVDMSFLASPMLDDKGNLISTHRPTSAAFAQAMNSSNKVPQTFKLDPSGIKAKNNTPNISSVTPKTQYSEESSGGYFAIPIAHQRSRSNPTSPPALERLEKKHSTSSSTSNHNMSSNSSAVIPTFKSVNSPSFPTSAGSFTGELKLPTMRVNDQNVAVNPPQFQRSVSASSLPTSQVPGENDPGAAAGFYNNSNTSGNSLTAVGSAGASRVANVRKHKKNVSFSSLSSLKFSKRGSTAQGYYINEQMMHNGIEENDGDDVDSIPAHGKAIKLTQSLYS